MSEHDLQPLTHLVIEGNVTRRVVTISIPGLGRIELGLEYCAQLRAKLLEAEQAVAAGGFIQ